MKRLVMLAAAFLATISASAAHASPLADEVTEVPFVFEQGHIIIPIKIKRDVAVEVILATGYEHSIVDPIYLQKYKLAASGSRMGEVTYRNKTFTFVSVEDVAVGEVKTSVLNMLLLSLSDVRQRVGREIFGIVGVDFFRGRVVQFDFSKKIVRFLAGAPAASSQTQKNPHIILPMRYSSDRLILPVADVLIEGKKFRALIDTGVVTTLSLSPSAGKELGLTPPPEKSNPRMDKIGSLRFSELDVTAVPVMIFAKGSGFYRDLKEFEAIIGTIMLQNFTVTFDFRKHEVIMDRP